MAEQYLGRRVTRSSTFFKFLKKYFSDNNVILVLEHCAKYNRYSVTFRLYVSENKKRKSREFNVSTLIPLSCNQLLLDIERKISLNVAIVIVFRLDLYESSSNSYKYSFKSCNSCKSSWNSSNSRKFSYNSYESSYNSLKYSSKSSNSCEFPYNSYESSYKHKFYMGNGYFAISLLLFLGLRKACGVLRVVSARIWIENIVNLSITLKQKLIIRYSQCFLISILYHRSLVTFLASLLEVKILFEYTSETMPLE